MRGSNLVYSVMDDDIENNKQSPENSADNRSTSTVDSLENIPSILKHETHNSSNRIKSITLPMPQADDTIQLTDVKTSTNKHKKRPTFNTQRSHSRTRHGGKERGAVRTGEIVRTSALLAKVVLAIVVYYE